MKRWGSILCKSALILCGSYGVLLQAGAFSNAFSWNTFRMFTTLSNLFLIAYTCGALFMLLKNGREDVLPDMHFAALISISLTAGVAALLLGPMFANASATMKTALFLLHDVTVALAWIDYLFFTKKPTFLKKDVYVGMLPPLVYLLFFLCTGIPGPYPFMNVELLGWGRVLLNSVGLGLLVYLAGRGLLWFDKHIKKVN